MTSFPLKSDKDTLPPPLVLAVKLGARSPSFSFSSIGFPIIVFGLSAELPIVALVGPWTLSLGFGTGGWVGTQLAAAIPDIEEP